MDIDDLYPVVIVDPVGMHMDVVEQIEPEAEWWDAYTTDTEA